MRAQDEQEAGRVVTKDGEPWLVPAPRAAREGYRVVGPGRRERVLASELDQARAGLERARAELEAAALCERGTRRFVDRVEQELLRACAEAARLREAQARLVLALGGLQRENELLAGRVRALSSGSPPEAPPDVSPGPGGRPHRTGRGRSAWPWRRARA